MVDGAIGEIALKPAELELKRELVQIQHQPMVELIVQENQLRIVKQIHVLVSWMNEEFKIVSWAIFYWLS